MIEPLNDIDILERLAPTEQPTRPLMARAREIIVLQDRLISTQQAQIEKHQEAYQIQKEIVALLKTQIELMKAGS